MQTGYFRVDAVGDLGTADALANGLTAKAMAIAAMTIIDFMTVSFP